MAALIRRPVTALLAVVVGTLGAVTSLAVAPAPAGGQTAGGLDLVRQDVAVEPSGTFRLQLRLPGVFFDDDVLIVSIHEPLTDPDDVAEVNQGGDLGRVLGTPVVAVVDDLEPDRTGLVEVEIALNDGSTGLQINQLGLARGGVYPVRVDLRTAGQDLVGSLVTHLVRLPDGDDGDVVPPMVGVAAELHAGPAEGGAGAGLDRAEVGAAAARLSSLADPAAAPVTLSVTPVLLDEWAGDDRRLDAVRAVAGDGHLDVRPWVRLDEAAMAGAGLSGEIEGLTARGAEVTRDRLGTEADAEIRVLYRDASPRRLDALAEVGVQAAVVPLSSVERPPGVIAWPPTTPLRTDDANGLRLVVSRDDLVARMAGATDPELAVSHILAELSAAAFDDDAGPDVVALAIGSEVELDASALDALLVGLAESPLIEAATVADLLAAAGLSTPAAQLTDADDAPFAGGGEGYRTARRALGGYRSMIFDSEVALLHDPLQEELLQTLSADVDGEERVRVWNQIGSRIRLEIDQITGPPIDSAILSSREGPVPFSFRNDARYPMRVEVTFVSEQLTFPEMVNGETATLVLPPGVTPVEFEVRSLTSGSFPLEILLRSPDGALDLDEQRVRVRSTELSGVGLIVTIGAAGFLLVWWLEHTRRNWRRRRSESAQWADGEPVFT